MPERDGDVLVQAQQHLRLGIAEVIDQAVVQPAIGRAGIERDVAQPERAQHVGHGIAAPGGVAAGRHRPFAAVNGGAWSRSSCLTAARGTETLGASWHGGGG
jgi:hypothetical protein